MKKWLTLILSIVALNAYGKPVDIVDIRTKIAKEAPTLDPFRAIRLMKKMDAKQTKFKRRILATMLELEFEDLEQKIYLHLKKVRKLVKLAHQNKEVESEEIIESEKKILNFEDALQVITEWKYKYLKGLKKQMSLQIL